MVSLGHRLSLDRASARTAQGWKWGHAGSSDSGMLTPDKTETDAAQEKASVSLFNTLRFMSSSCASSDFAPGGSRVII